MLIKFTVSNFLSFKKETSLEMFASNQTVLGEQLYKSKSRHIPRILKSAMIFGPNASGKSNLIKAIEYAVSIVLNKRNSLKKRTLYFKLCPECPDLPISFEFEILNEKTIYRFGFKTLDSTIIEEWLYKTISTGEQKIYKRTFDENRKEKNEIMFGDKYNEYKNDAELNFIVSGTPSDKLFLSETVIRNRDDFKDVFNWFKKIVIIYPQAKLNSYNILLESKDLLEHYRNILRLSDLGIDDIIVTPTDFDDLMDKISFKFPKLLDNLAEKNYSMSVYYSSDKRYLIIQNESKREAFEISLKHKSIKTGKTVEFNINEESDGTNRLFDLIPLLDLAIQNKIILIDEMQRSLHPLLIRNLLQEYFRSNKNNQSQLIATSHDVTLLDVKLLRRDSIWFVKKDNEMSSLLYSLVEYKTVRSDKVLNKAYLAGLYGAIPRLNK